LLFYCRKERPANTIEIHHRYSGRALVLAEVVCVCCCLFVCLFVSKARGTFGSTSPMSIPSPRSPCCPTGGTSPPCTSNCATSPSTTSAGRSVARRALAFHSAQSPSVAAWREQLPEPLVVVGRVVSDANMPVSEMPLCSGSSMPLCSNAQFLLYSYIIYYKVWKWASLSGRKIIIIIIIILLLLLLLLLLIIII